MEAYDLVFDALGDRTRRQTFELLKGGPQSVGALAERLPVSRPAVSQHLRVLKEAGLVRDEQVGTRRLYRVDPGSLDALRAYLDDFWSEALARFKERAESKGNPP
ncbi:MAG: metalloregulator ArsR/SmtB family transcription factor [Actinomycetota bacterium]|nr:metalloregulator ArsR/SmtB family transcription factor [Actinomycetota bacterium]